MKLENSQYRLRKAIGLLGFALPFLLLLGHYDLLASMSHYYYTASGVFFISILTAFGLILLTYQGYPKGSKELISDDRATSLAGFFAIVTALVPTSSEDSLGIIHFHKNFNYLFGHNDNWKGALHLLSAAAFLALLGYMCFAKFTMSQNISKTKKFFYKTCGLIIWISIALIAFIFLIENQLNIKFNEFLPAYTFWLEMVAVWAFAIAWLIKGKVDKDIQTMYAKMRQPNT